MEAEGNKRTAELVSEGEKIRMKNESEGTLIKITNEAEARKVQLILEVSKLLILFHPAVEKNLGFQNTLFCPFSFLFLLE